MNCPNCRHEQADDARFCAECGTPLTQSVPVSTTTQTPAAPPAAPAGSRKTSLLVLALVLLLLALGVSAALYVVAAKARATPAPVAAQNTARPNEPSANVAALQQRAPSTATALGGALGTGGAKDAPASGKAPESQPQAGQQSEQHDKPSGNTGGAPDAAAAGQAASAIGGFLGALSNAVGGVHRHDPVDFHALEALLPSALPGMQNAPPAGNADETMSIKTTSAHVDFTGPSDARITLSIRDATAISGLAGLADMANADSSEQGDSYEKSETIDGRSLHEKWDATARHGELSMSVGQRFAVDVVGDNVDMAALKNALAHIDLAKLESMKDANPVAK
jgi:hypothetical protein